MDKSESQPSRKKIPWGTALKNLVFYGLVPLLLLILLVQPIQEAARGSARAAWLILLAALGVVVLNWLAYRFIRRKHPSLLVFSYGIFCLVIVAAIQYLALPGSDPLVSTLSILGVTLLQVVLILLSFWFVSLKTKPAYAAAVTIRVIVGIFLAIMAGQIARDIETGLVNGYTWLTLGILVALLLGLCGSKVRSAFLGATSRRRKTALAEGRIVKIVGVTHFDVDDDLVTLFHAHIQYAVHGVPYETRADITRYTLRRYGKDAFIGGEIPVRYDPADPADAYVERIRKPVVKNPPEEEVPETPAAEES